MPRYHQVGGFGEPLYLVYSECVYSLLIFQPSTFEHPECVTRPETYTEKWLTTDQHDAALAGRIPVREETWKDRFRRAKAKLISSRSKV